MREVRLNKDLPGIALSGFGTEQDVNQASSGRIPSISPKRFTLSAGKRDDSEYAASAAVQ